MDPHPTFGPWRNVGPTLQVWYGCDGLWTSGLRTWLFRVMKVIRNLPEMDL